MSEMSLDPLDVDKDLLNMGDVVDIVECASTTIDDAKEKVTVRYYDNQFDDYEKDGKPNVKFIEDGKLKKMFLLRIQATANTYLGRLIAESAEVVTSDYTVYAGIGGWALLFFMLGCSKNNPLYLRKALVLSQRALSKLKYKRLSFLGGDMGPLAIGVVLMYNHGLVDQARALLARMDSMLPQVMSSISDPGVPDDVLLGRAGYLYALLFVHTHLNDDMVSADTMRDVTGVVLRSCCAVAARESFPAPLMPSWLEKPYLGASRGLAGVLYILLLAREFLDGDNLEMLVRPSIDYLVEECELAGNLPTAAQQRAVDLVQWCHGAPGAIFLFCLAYTVFDDARYLAAAEMCGETVWERGLLRKGYGICHGVSGNGYAFLQLYQVTDHPKHLHRACVCAEWCTEYGKFADHEPEHPLSLFDGIAGVIYFLTEVQEPKLARYPGFMLPLPRAARYSAIPIVMEV